MENKKINSSFRNFANSYFKSMFNLKHQNESFMIDSIRFKNFANYQDEQIFYFSTKSKIKTEKNNSIDWNSKNSKKYKKVSGIWGRNASGKTTFLEIIHFASEYFNYSMNISSPKRPNKFERSKTGFYSLNDPINNEVKNEKNYFIPDSAFQLIGDETKNSYIEIKFDTKKGDLFYLLDINSTKKEKDIQSKEKKLFSDSFFYEVKESFWIKKNNGELENLWNSYEDNSFKIYSYLVKKTKNENNSLTQNNDNENNLMVSSVFVLFNFFTRLIFSFDYSVTSNADVESIRYFIAEFITILYTERFKKPFGEITESEWKTIQKETEEMILLYIKTLDPSVKKIRLTLSENVFENKRIANLDITKENGKNITFGCLSSGTLVFVVLSLRLKIMLMTSDRETPFFFFFDELGNNWHSNLTSTFISLFEYSIFGENIYLVFTSHDPLIADELDNDSIYYIDNEKNIKRFDETRNDKKFSSDYLNQTVNKLDTNAAFNDFDDYMDNFEA